MGGGFPLPALDINTQQQSPLAEFGKVLQLKNLMQQGQTQQLEQTGLSQENQQRALQLKDQQTLRDLSPKFVTKDSSGNVNGYDFNGFYNAATSAGVSPKTVSDLQLSHADATQKLSAAGEAAIKLEDSKNDASYKLLEGVRGVTDPVKRQQVYQDGLPGLQKVGVDTSKLPAQVPLDDNSLTQLEAGLGMHSQIIADAKTSAETQANLAKAGSEKAAQFKEIPGTGMFFNPVTNETKTPAGVTLTPQQMESKYVQLQAQKNQGQKIEPADQAFMQGFEKMKTLVPQFTFNMQQGALKGGALDMPSEMYFQTGQLPAGMRSPAMSAAIMSRAAELHPGGATELAGNKAAFAANEASYKNVTSTLDTLSAFEQSGLKNLKQFTDLAGKLPDTGVPWLNTPVRLLNQNLVGAQYMPAINAARNIALREIARVTNDPKLSGSLTDSARQEVQGFSPANSTLPQILNVVKVLQNDMANVHSSLQQQKEDIGNRLGIKSNSTQAGGGGSAKVLTQSQLQQAAKDHNVSVEEATRQAQAAGYEVKP